MKVKNITFIGMGLINSSLARAIKRNNFADKLVATSKSSKTRDRVKELCLVDHVVETYEESVKDADLIVIGIPVAAYRDVFIKIKPYIKKNAIITDVGSVKKSIIEDIKNLIPKDVNFIPGHPIAGTENSGPDAGFADLFEGGWCILTPDKQTSKKELEIVKNMWKSVGMNVDIMSAEYHDMVLAITSHIPHIIAYSIVGTVANLEERLKQEVTKYAASGFKDFTRIAASDPIMWRDILLQNKSSILDMLELFKKDLSSLEQAIKREDSLFLEKLFTKTRAIRKEITSKI